MMSSKPGTKVPGVGLTGTEGSWEAHPGVRPRPGKYRSRESAGHGEPGTMAPGIRETREYPGKGLQRTGRRSMVPRWARSGVGIRDRMYRESVRAGNAQAKKPAWAGPGVHMEPVGSSGAGVVRVADDNSAGDVSGTVSGIVGDRASRVASAGVGVATVVCASGVASVVIEGSLDLGDSDLVIGGLAASDEVNSVEIEGPVSVVTSGT
ncbi:hypothetical protein L6452_38503 [Arctium lappa]|uniref:Uncharacterized protein n=1 Tax=Arctium lappa TaxID=4217 RepID=A0ACB8XPQ0_ARCLA|nr:hypothetical protein L6452_38503 [Arctium lappa]